MIKLGAGTKIEEISKKKNSENKVSIIPTNIEQNTNRPQRCIN